MDYFTRDKIEEILNTCIDRLFKQDQCLLTNDVSERAITHKLAEYLQHEIPEFHVDCEYNRNAENGPNAPKAILRLTDKTREQYDEQHGKDDLLSISTYPDIIVHRRMTNDDNLLVVEVKKANSSVNPEHDYAKLRAFTEKTEFNSYNFKYGVFVKLDTGDEYPRRPTFQWFVGGVMVDMDDSPRFT